MSGESASCDMSYVLHWQKKMLPPQLIGYAAEDVYNLDETGLFFKCLPNRTFAFKGEKCHGGKHSKERITVVPVCNMTGTHKFPLIVIGKSKSPRCFKNVRSLPVEYYNSTKAWMTTDIYNRILLKLDSHFSEAGRQILLFVDNCPSHILLPTTELKSITIKFLPPNYTSLLQPLDAGIIRNMKHSYRTRILKKSIQHMRANNELKKIDLLEAIETLSAAWSEDVKNESIANCFKHAGFGKYQLDSENAVEQMERDESVECANDSISMDNLVTEFTDTFQLISDENIPNDFIPLDYMNIDDNIIIDGGIVNSAANGAATNNTDIAEDTSIDSTYSELNDIMSISSSSSGEESSSNEILAAPPQVPSSNHGDNQSVEKSISIVLDLLKRSTSIPEHAKDMHMSAVASLLNE